MESTCFESLLFSLEERRQISWQFPTSRQPPQIFQVDMPARDASVDAEERVLQVLAQALVVETLVRTDVE